MGMQPGGEAACPQLPGHFAAIRSDHSTNHSRLCGKQTEGAECGQEDQRFLMGLCRPVDGSLDWPNDGRYPTECEAFEESQVCLHGGS